MKVEEAKRKLKRNRSVTGDMTAIVIAIFISMILFFWGCSTPNVGVNIEGNWVGTNWYCSNTDHCGYAKAIDVDARLDFTILEVNENGSLTITAGDYYYPTCIQNPRCNALPWEVRNASFVENRLHIEWESGHTFNGTLIGAKFVGVTDYVIPEFSYVFNDAIEIIRK